MMKEIISTTAAPAAIGPYSQAVKVGNLIFCSGQIPLDPATGEMIGGGIAEQTRQVMANLGAVLTSAGASYADLVKTTIYLTDLGCFALVNEIYAEYCGTAAPARATVEVAGLPKGALIEIEGVAVID